MRTIRSRRGNRCNHCRAGSLTRDLVIGDSGPTRHSPPVGSQPVPPGEQLDESPIPISPIRDIVITKGDVQLLGDFHRATAMATPRSIVSRCATAWTECFEEALDGL